MSETTVAAGGDLRARILQDPDAILGDPALLRALVARTQAAGAANVVDLRSVAMARLEARLDELEAAHRTVIAAAYDNLAGTQQIHRAILRLLDAESCEAFVEGLAGEVAAILRLDAVRLLVEDDDAPEDKGAPQSAEIVPFTARSPRTEVSLPPPVPPSGESRAPGEGPSGAASDGVLRPVPRGFLARRVATGGGALPPVSLLRGDGLLAELGAIPEGCAIASEACLALDLGPGGPAAALVLGSREPSQFAPGQGTELMEFLAGVLSRALRRWME